VTSHLPIVVEGVEAVVTGGAKEVAVALTVAVKDVIT
jgi:hypothetical protein